MSASGENPVRVDGGDPNKEKQLSSSGSESDDDAYMFRTRVCGQLSREFGIDEVIIDKITPYIPPEKHGLENSDYIIPAYYQLTKHPSKIFSVDYLYIIKDDIRNFRKLNRYQLDYIKQLNDEDKHEIIEIFNECNDTISELFNTNS